MTQSDTRHRPGPERPLRVFHLIKSLGRGGAEMLLLDGPRQSAPEEFVYGFGYFLPWKDALVSELRRHHSDVTCFESRNSAAMFGQVTRVAAHLRRWRADLVHCHLPLASVVGRLAGRLARVPVISTEHNLLERYHAATRAATLATWRLQDSVLAVSGEVAASIARHAGDRVDVRVVQNGVSLDRFSREAFDQHTQRAAFGVPADAPVIGTVAVFRKQKRLDLWLEVARRISASTPEARFVLVGDGPLRDEVMRNIAAFGLTNRVILPGLQEDVRPYLAMLDVYLMSSDFEGLPVALLEAMAMEAVPVVTDAGGIPEVVSHGHSGFVLPKGDVPRLTAAVQMVLEASDDQRRGWGRAARQAVARGFSVERMMREIEGIYRDVIGHGR